MGFIWHFYGCYMHLYGRVLFVCLCVFLFFVCVCLFVCLFVCFLEFS